MSGDSGSFRGHCASALTHPATVAAVVVLLLNDALFKSLWPDSWVTGKLSDLAWVVFASPFWRSSCRCSLAGAPSLNGQRL